MTNLIIEMALLAIVLYQHWFWSRETHRLIDKIMSGNYHAYVASSAALPKAPRDRINIQGELEDLNSIQGFNPLS